ncbi:inositol monophosphatase family protein [Streptomyces sp. NPDC006733]|uniref:inositol monophosphatase family protein n=1 Tax=Streptomyces sp. NPDC006733 TaxID=3155460 RepID=UPI00340A3265
MTDLRALLRIASKAVDLATAVVGKTAVGTVTAKGDRDMVSDIDFAVEEKVREFLTRETPEIGFLGEENGGSGIEGPLTWALDPVDGTANLVNGLPLCAVSLGLIDNNESVLGVIDLPFLGQRFQAARGHGVHNGDIRIQASRASSLGEAIVSIGDYAVGEGANERNRERLAMTRILSERVLRVRMFGSAAIDLAWVASGKLDACIALSNHPWDMAAGTAIAREAGALVMDSKGEPHMLSSRATVAVAPGLREDILKVLADMTSATRPAA